MRRRRIILSAVILALAVAVLAMGGCSAGETEAPAADTRQGLQRDKTAAAPETRDYVEDVVRGARLFQKNGVVFWGYDDRLCSALIGENGELYDFVSEGSMGADIEFVAMDDHALYLATEIGLIRLPVDQAEQEQGYAVVLGNDTVSSSGGFQLYEDYIYYISGYSLRRVPTSPGEREKLEEDISCMQVTSKGIYCLNKEGELLLVSLDGSERKTLCKLDSEGSLGVFGSTAYITTGEADDYVYTYDLDRDEWEKLELEEALSPYHPVWVSQGKLYYNNESYDLRCLDLASGEEELLPTRFYIPGYEEGFMLDGFGYYKLSDGLFWAELGGDYWENVQLNQVMSSGEDLLADYEIAKNIGVGYDGLDTEYLYSDYFNLNMPAGTGWDYEVLGRDAVEIFYYPARKAGYGGTVVTITAYLANDDSYKSLPHYTVAGESRVIRYIAQFPTDLQYSSETEEGWRLLYEHSLEIDINNPDNPFSCLWAVV